MNRMWDCRGTQSRDSTKFKPHFLPQNCDVLCYERHALSHRFSCVDSFSFDFIIEALLMDVKFEANVNEWFPFQKNPSTSQKNLLEKQKERKNLTIMNSTKQETKCDDEEAAMILGGASAPDVRNEECDNDDVFDENTAANYESDQSNYRSQQTDDSNVVQEEENKMPLSNINAESNNDNNDDENDSVSEPKKESFLEQASSKALRPFVIISSSYLLYTITDGAIRMIVLLQAYKLNFSALEVAIMFSLYELAGVFTNLAAGVMGAKWGIKFTLICGLTLQLFAYGLLFAWNDDWPKKSAIIYVTFAQMFAGVAKDLTKLGGKTVTKLVTPEEQETKLFKLVSLITGWKNSLKGVGYFLGSALISINYELALGVMMGIVLLAMPWAILGLDKSLGTAKEKNASFREIFVLDNKNLNWLSLARLFLFASRDFWFEVPLPFFLRSPSCEGLGETQCFDSISDCTRGAICGSDGLCANMNVGGGCGGLGLSRVLVGTILGGYIILYGQVQSWTPQTVTTPLSQTPPNKLTEILWGFVNCLPTLVMWIVMTWGPAFMNYEVTAMTTWIIAAVVAFAFIFAINSSIHSFLVVKYASKDKIAASVGFYYMSNACGRLFGTLGSGFLYSYVGEDYGDAAGNDAVAGLASCFLAGTICSLLAAAITFKIDDQQSGLKCGSCVTIIPSREEEPSSIMQEVIVVDGTDDHNVTLDDKKN